MATVGVIPGTSFVMYMAGTKIGLLTSNSFNIDRAEREIANKDSGIWKEYKVSRMGWNFTCDFMVGSTTNADLADILAALIAGTAIALVQASTESGDPQVSGNGFLRNVKVDAADDGNVTGSAEFIGTGALTPGTVS